MERAADRKIRDHNTPGYRLSHWPIWIFVFFITPGPLTFKLFESGVNLWMVLWLGGVMAATAIAGLRGRLPGCEPRPYIIRFTEDKPNPLYRRVCYTVAWSAVLSFGLVHIGGLVVAIVTGVWMMQQMYWWVYFPLLIVVWGLGAFGRLPRVKPSTEGEGHERRYFYGSVWAMCIAQPVLWFLWGTLPYGRVGDVVKLAVFVGILALVGWWSYRGKLPRTRPIVPGELAVSD